MCHQGDKKPEVKPQEKIVSLCEDMNHHEHDEKSYNKIQQEKVAQTKNEK